MEAVQKCANWNEWGALVHMLMIEFHTHIFAWFLCSSGPPSKKMASHLESWAGMHLGWPAWCGWGNQCFSNLFGLPPHFQINS